MQRLRFRNALSQLNVLNLNMKMLFLFSSVTPNMLQSPECTSHILQAYADMGPIDPFNIPRGICVDESDINATSWIPR